MNASVPQVAPSATPVAMPAPPASPPPAWYEFWKKKGGARKSRRTRKSPVLANSYVRQMQIVNGKVCMNREYRVMMTNKGQRITGHNGKRKFNITRRFKKRNGRKSRKH